MAGKTKRKNIYFRQTPKEFRAEKQNAIYEHFNKNLPFKIYSFSQRHFESQVLKLKRAFNKIKVQIPKGAKRVK